MLICGEFLGILCVKLRNCVMICDMDLVLCRKFLWLLWLVSRFVCICMCVIGVCRLCVIFVSIMVCLCLVMVSLLVMLLKLLISLCNLCGLCLCIMFRWWLVWCLCVVVVRLWMGWFNCYVSMMVIMMVNISVNVSVLVKWFSGILVCGSMMLCVLFVGSMCSVLLLFIVMWVFGGSMCCNCCLMGLFVLLWKCCVLVVGSCFRFMNEILRMFVLDCLLLLFCLFMLVVIFMMCEIWKVVRFVCVCLINSSDVRWISISRFIVVMMSWLNIVLSGFFIGWVVGNEYVVDFVYGL